MNETQLLKRIQLLKKRPDLAKELTPTELSELVLIVLGFVKRIDTDIKNGRLKGKDAKELVADKDYLSSSTAKKMLEKAVNEAVENLSKKADKTASTLEKKVNKKLKNIKSGKDAVITDDMLIRIADTAKDLVEIPEVATAINAEPEVIRNALELLNGKEKLSIDAVRDLRESLSTIEKKISNVKVDTLKSVGGTSKNLIVKTILEKIADGTIGGGGGAVDSVNGETGVVVLTTGDIAEDTDNNYVTDAEKTAIAANTSARHDPVTVTDSSEIDFTVTGQDITASLKTGSIDVLKLDTGVQSSLTQVATNTSDITTLDIAISDHVDDTAGAHDASAISVDNSNLEVLTGNDSQALWEENDSALLKARGTEVLGVTGAVTFTIGGTTFNVASTQGQIKDSTGYYAIDYAGATGVSVITTSSPSIYVYIDKAGALQQQTTEPTREEFREKLFLTRLAFSGGTLAAQEEIANPSGQYTNSLRDYLSYIASPKKGLGLSGNANLTFAIASGSVFELGTQNSQNADSPNEVLLDAKASVTYFYVDQDSTIATAQTNLNVTQYDVGGTPTTMTNNRFKVETVYQFNSGNVVVQMGQNQYSSLDEAQTAISTRSFTPNPIVANGTRIGWIIVQKNATDLSDTADARFINDEGTFSTSTGTAGALIASNNFSDLDNPTTARANLGVEIGVDVQGILAEGAFVDGDKTKLDGIEASADVTDTANVTAAGALMDSELTDITAVKGINQDLTTTSDVTFADITYTTAIGGVSALGNLGTTETIDWSTASHFTGNLDNDVTITHSNETSGQKITLVLSYSGAQRTITWSDVDEWSGGVEPTAPAIGETLIVTLLFVGTTCYGSYELFS